MARERFAPDDPREWLNRAFSNLARAREALEDVYLEDLCFDAQQAAEKALKAVLIKHGVAFPYVHDLDQLLELVEQALSGIPEEVQAAGLLTRFAVVTSYPGAIGVVTRADHKDALATADAVVRWAEEQLSERA